MNLNHLRVFFHVAATASFSRAAERLGVSQPNVSAQVKRLEEALGIALVEQVGRELHLTPAGATLSDYAQRIFHLAAQAEVAMADLHGLRCGHLTVGASTVPGAYLLPRVAAAFRQEHPGVGLSLWIDNTRTVADRLARGELDLAVVGEAVAGHPDLSLEPLFHDFLVVVAAPGHPLTQGGPLAPADLVRHPLILREAGSSTRQVLEDRLRALGLAVTAALEVRSNEAVKQAVAAGLGPGVTSRLAAAWELADGRLAAVPVTGVDLRRTFCLARPRDRRLSPAAAAFVHHLEQAAVSTDFC